MAADRSHSDVWSDQASRHRHSGAQRVPLKTLSTGGTHGRAVWLRRGSLAEALKVQRPLPDELLKIVITGQREDAVDERPQLDRLVLRDEIGSTRYRRSGSETIEREHVRRGREAGDQGYGGVKLIEGCGRPDARPGYSLPCASLTKTVGTISELGDQVAGSMRSIWTTSHRPSCR